MRPPLDRSDWKQPKAVLDTKPIRVERPRLNTDLPAKPRMGVLVDPRGHLHRCKNKFKYDRMLYAAIVAPPKRSAVLSRCYARPSSLKISRTDLHALAEQFLEVVAGARWPRLTGDDYRIVALALTLAGWSDTAERRYPRHRFSLHPVFKETIDGTHSEAT
jgi:hypothetical protein